MYNSTIIQIIRLVEIILNKPGITKLWYEPNCAPKIIIILKFLNIIDLHTNAGNQNKYER